MNNSQFISFKLEELTKVRILSKRPRIGVLTVLLGPDDDFGLRRMSEFGFESL